MRDTRTCRAGVVWMMRGRDGGRDVEGGDGGKGGMEGAWYQGVKEKERSEGRELLHKTRLLSSACAAFPARLLCLSQIGARI